MEKTKKYAIRCKTDKQVRECCIYNLHRFSSKIKYIDEEFTNLGYTIISYKEAVKMGLLGKKKTTVKDVLIYEAKQKIRDINNNELIEKIMKDINIYAFGTDRMIGTDVKEIRNILTKHLSSK